MFSTMMNSNIAQRTLRGVSGNQNFNMAAAQLEIPPGGWDRIEIVTAASDLLPARMSKVCEHISLDN